MRDVVVYHLLSLDGVAEEPSDWFVDDCPQLFDLVRRVIATQDAVLLGRGTYEYWYEHWPTSDVEPFATFINTTPKYVATSSELPGDWSLTTRIEGPVEGFVRELQERPGGDIGVHGSTTLARSLIAAGLVDRLWFVVPATIAGHGARLFDAHTTGPRQRFELLDLERTPAGTLYLHYGRAAT